MILFHVAPSIARGNKSIYHSSLLFDCVNFIYLVRPHLLSWAFTKTPQGGVATATYIWASKWCFSVLRLWPIIELIRLSGCWSYPWLVTISAPDAALKSRAALRSVQLLAERAVGESESASHALMPINLKRLIRRGNSAGLNPNMFPSLVFHVPTRGQDMHNAKLHRPVSGRARILYIGHVHTLGYEPALRSAIF